MDTSVMNGSEGAGGTGAGGTGTGTATAADGGEVRFERCSNARVVERRDDGSPWLIRSAAPDDLTDADEARLRGLGVSTIVDLREPGEGHPRHFRGITTVPVPIYRLEGGAPRTGTLEGIYAFMLRHRGADLARAVGAIADAPGAALVHCSIGKDRTGLVVALARLAAGSAQQGIIDDYALSGGRLGDAIRRRTLEEVDQDAPGEPEHSDTLRMRLDSPVSMMASICDQLQGPQGAVRYLLRNGLMQTQLAALRGKCASAGRLTILHLSDLHAEQPPARLFGHIDSLDAVAMVPDYLRSLAVRPDAIVVTGDLIHHDVRAYRRVCEALQRLSDDLGAPLCVVPGNHDDVDAAADALGRYTTAAVAPQSFGVRGYTLHLLDSSEGYIAPEALAGLRKSLHAPCAGDGADQDGAGLSGRDSASGNCGGPSILVMHHSPVGSLMPSLRHIALHNADALADAISGADVRLILAGHFHHAMQGVFHGVPVCVAPSMAYEQRMDAGTGLVEGRSGAAFSIEELGPEGLRVTTVPMSLADDTLFSVPAGTSTHPGHQHHSRPSVELAAAR